jgi:hypothetical protein
VVGKEVITKKFSSSMINKIDDERVIVTGVLEEEAMKNVLVTQV